MTFQDKCRQIGVTHARAFAVVHHYFRPQQKPPYAIWQENGASLYHANNREAEFRVSGTTDYFTKEEYDPAVDRLQGLFEGLGFSWSLESVQYEPGTNLIHYEWSWEV